MNLKRGRHFYDDWCKHKSVMSPFQARQFSAPRWSAGATCRRPPERAASRTRKRCWHPPYRELYIGKWLHHRASIHHGPRYTHRQKERRDRQPAIPCTRRTHQRTAGTHCPTCRRGPRHLVSFVPQGAICRPNCRDTRHTRPTLTRRHRSKISWSSPPDRRIPTVPRWEEQSDPLAAGSVRLVFLRTVPSRRDRTPSMGFFGPMALISAELGILPITASHWSCVT